MQVLLLILILIIVAYLALFSLFNRDPHQLNLLLRGGVTQEVYMWQLLAAGVGAGILLSLLALAGRGGGARKRLRSAEQQLREALALAQDARKRLADLEAENERLRGQARGGAEESKAAPGESGNTT